MDKNTSLIELAVEKNAVDFQDMVGNLLEAKSLEAISIIAEGDDDEEFDFDVDVDDVEEFSEDDLTDEQLQWVVENITEEEFEQLDELSKKTLGSYIKKASGSEGDPRSDDIGKSSTLRDTQKFFDNKDNRMFGKNYSEKTFSKGLRIDKNRSTGIKKAVSRLTKEDVEELDELSKKTLGSYVKKASVSTANMKKHMDDIDTAKNAAYKARNPDGRTSQATQDHRKDSLSYEDSLNKLSRKVLRKKYSREDGIHTALKKLTKEDVAIEEGRGKKGQARHASDDNDDFSDYRKSDSRKSFKSFIRDARKSKFANQEA